mgnify:CR=1 FL=1
MGKTTFTRYLINNLQNQKGLKETEVLSPTFNLLYEYEIKDLKIMHYDLYRIEKTDELHNLGIFTENKKTIKKPIIILRDEIWIGSNAIIADFIDKNENYYYSGTEWGKFSPVLSKNIVNLEIEKATSTETKLMSYQDAIDSGALAFFGDKYGDEVRVVSLGGEFSVELCGGTHVKNTSEIEGFIISNETSVS